MKVRDARAAASTWVSQHAGEIPNFVGAYVSGSAAWLPAEAELPATSDVDVMVVTTDDHAAPKLGKLLYDGVLIEVSYLPWNRIHTSTQVLSSYHLAGGFRTNTILADPTGRLAEVQAATAKDYAKRRWVRRRCQDAERKISDGLTNLDASQPLHDQVTAVLFPTGVTTHLLLTAGLRNPTVRLRYLAARTLLEEYDRPDFHEELLRLLGCADVTPERVEHHLQAMTEAFDASAAVAKTPFFFSSDITAPARPIAVDGSRDLIRQGRHREAVFWIVATYARCLKILTTDAPTTYVLFLAGFAELIGDLGITTHADLRRRAQDVLDFMPRLREIKDEILAENPDIED